MQLIPFFTLLIAASAHMVANDTYHENDGHEQMAELSRTHPLMYTLIACIGAIKLMAGVTLYLLRMRCKRAKAAPADESKDDNADVDMFVADMHSHAHACPHRDSRSNMINLYDDVESELPEIDFKDVALD